MDNISKQKLDAKRENAKRHNDSDYELRQSIDRYYEKNGYLKSIFMVFIGIPLSYMIFIMISALISVYVHWLIAVIISFSGIGLFLFYKKQKKNNSLFVKENIDSIELTTPLNLDLSIILSGLLFFTGLLIISFAFQLIWIVMLVSMIALFVYIKAFKKIRYSLFDKIVISKDFIKVDDPDSKGSIEIIKSHISKLVLLTITDGSSEKRLLEFQFETEESYNTIEISEKQIKNLRLNFDLLLESLLKMGYKFQKETAIEGRINRLNENGNQILN
jgi:hypothetical protein